MTRVSDRNDWFDLWLTDKESILTTMENNINADLAAGYNPSGDSISCQRKELHTYKVNFHAQLDQFVDWDDTKVNRWCYFDMLKRGAIE